MAFNNSFSQTLTGIITYSNVPIKNVIISINQGEQQFFSDSSGSFKVPFNKKKLTIHIQYPGFIPIAIKLSHITKDTLVHIDLLPDTLYFQEIDIVGTQPLISKKLDAFNTEIYSACVLSSYSANNLFEGAQNIAGLRPQLNCNICNTGDIHINGMEGPYT
ncbi:MAG: hypothetical protein N2203_08935, partial [Bacteroidia bacterium]|nr:hypothetical protein [Bacteroidia bacterium]